MAGPYRSPAPEAAHERCNVQRNAMTPRCPRIARVFCLVDSYEAIVRDDVGYRARRDHDAAYDELVELGGVRYESTSAASPSSTAATRHGSAAAVARCEPT